MKKLILIAICFVSFQLSAQGNLQFNQVINAEIVGTGTYEFNVVP